MSRGGYGRLLHNRNFLLLSSATGVSAFGDAFFELAVIWLVYSQSGSTLQAATVTVAYTLGRALVAPIAGAFVDRWDRRRTMVAVDLIRAAVDAALVLLAWRHALSTVVAVGGVFTLTVAAQFFGPARGAIWPVIVDQQDLVTSNGVRQTTYYAANLAGKALAGVVVATFGIAWAIVIDALSFVGSATGAFLLRVPRLTLVANGQSPGWRSFLSDVAGGWSVVVRHQTVRVIMLAILMINFASFSAVIPALVRVQLHGSAAVYGVMEAASIIGSIAGGLVAGPADRWLGTGRLIGLSFLVTSLSFLGVGLSHSTPLTAVLMGSGALCAGIAPVAALYQSVIPSEYLGRAFALLGAAHTAASPFGALLFGWLGDVVGPGPTIILASCWGLLASAFAVLSPTVRNARVEANPL